MAFAVMVLHFNESPPPPKVMCTARSQGAFWPPETNRDQKALQEKAAAGDLWLCRGDYDWDAYFVSTIHFFKWQRLTVRVKRVKAATDSAY